MKKTELSIIVVNFGSRDKVLNLYKSILKFLPPISWELIIVDNPTKEKRDGEFLADYFFAKKNVHIVQLAKNLGYGEANNEAIKFTCGEFLVICNPDTEVLKNTFSILLEKIRGNLKLGIAVPVLQTKNGKTLENCRDFPTIFSLIGRRIFKTPFLEIKIPRKKIIETEWAQGSFWILRTETYRKLNGFDPRFFLFMEDIDFCRRVWKRKLKVVQITDAVAIHSPNRLSGGFIGSAVFRKTFWIHLQSVFLYFWKWRGGKS